MRYILRAFGSDTEIEIPEGWKFVSIPKVTKTSDGELMNYSIEVFDKEGTQTAVFTSVVYFFPKSFIPPKTEFVNKLPGELDWVAGSN